MTYFISDMNDPEDTVLFLVAEGKLHVCESLSAYKALDREVGVQLTPLHITREYWWIMDSLKTYDFWPGCEEGVNISILDQPSL